MKRSYEIAMREEIRNEVLKFCPELTESQIEGVINDLIKPCNRFYGWYLNCIEDMCRHESLGDLREKINEGGKMPELLTELNELKWAKTMDMLDRSQS